jgi:serine/threonine protein phosphatase PrpC
MEQAPAATEFMLEAEAVTRRGLSHDTNDDAYLANIDCGVFCVADGMGGHRDGHVASNAVVSLLERTLDPTMPFEQKVENTTRAVESVNATLYAQVRENPALDISGTTFLSLIVGEGYACCLWVGDSRLYLFRGGNLYLVSEDHAGADGVLTRAVGSAAFVEVERRILEIVGGDVFLLCSDGLLKGLDEDDMADLLSGASETSAERLLAKSVVGGSADDITIILVWVRA